MSNDEAYEEEQEHECVVACWEFSLWDVAGIATVGVSNVLGSVSHALGLLSTQFAAAANHQRQTRQLREAQRYNEAARRKMADDLERLISPEADPS